MYQDVFDMISLVFCLHKEEAFFLPRPTLSPIIMEVENGPQKETGRVIFQASIFHFLWEKGQTSDDSFQVMKQGEGGFPCQGKAPVVNVRRQGRAVKGWLVDGFHHRVFFPNSVIVSVGFPYNPCMYGIFTYMNG